MKPMIAIAGVILALRTLTSGLFASSSASRIISPTVVSSFVADAGEITLLVLWRGSPGWFFRGGPGHGSGGGGSAGPGTRVEWEYASFGGLTFYVEFDLVGRTVKVQGHDISLNDVNVMLFDSVDSPAGPQLVATRRLDLRLPDGEPGDPVQIAVRRHPELFDYLQCDTPLPPSAMPGGVGEPYQQYLQSTMTLLCQQMSANSR
jgi:hypothetical protein